MEEHKERNNNKEKQQKSINQTQSTKDKEEEWETIIIWLFREKRWTLPEDPSGYGSVPWARRLETGNMFMK